MIDLNKLFNDAVRAAVADLLPELLPKPSVPVNIGLLDSRVEKLEALSVPVNMRLLERRVEKLEGFVKSTMDFNDAEYEVASTTAFTEAIRNIAGSVSEGSISGHENDYDHDDFVKSSSDIDDRIDDKVRDVLRSVTVTLDV